MIPFKAQPINELQARYPAALVDVYDTDFVRRFPSEGPSCKQQHVFDYASNGFECRLIVSVDRAQDLPPFLHVSASCNSVESPSLMLVMQVLSEISGPGVLILRGWGRSQSDADVLHLVFDPPPHHQPSPQTKGETHDHN